MQIATCVQQLAAFPMSGKTGRVPGTRELVIANTPFIAAYTIDKADIVILAFPFTQSPGILRSIDNDRQNLLANAVTGHL
jgi:plasmid stabilization system protein ParE